MFDKKTPLSVKNINSTNQNIKSIFTQNPLDSILDQPEVLDKEKLKQEFLFQIDYKVWVFFLVTIVFSIAISFNTLFFKKVDSKFFFMLNKVAKLAVSLKLVVSETIMNHLEKPFVVTIGEFKTISEAKAEAIKLLPSFKQLTIEHLDNGYYVFVIDKLASKKYAYHLAEEFKDKKYMLVKVRYLPRSKK